MRRMNHLAQSLQWKNDAINQRFSKSMSFSSFELPTLSALKASISKCRTLTIEILLQLEQLKHTIRSHRSSILAAKTSSTTATTVGTTLAVTGLLLAPFTLGTSLLISSVGALSSVSGAAGHLITDLVDGSKKKGFLEKIQALGEEEAQAPILHQLETHLRPYLEQGFTQLEALYSSLVLGLRLTIEDAQKEAGSGSDEEFELVEEDQWRKKPIKKFAFRATIQSLKLVKNSQALSTLSAPAATASTTATATAAAAGRIVVHGALKTAAATVGIIFTSFDIAALVREWKSSDPTEQTVDAAIQELTLMEEKYGELLERLEAVDKIKFFSATLPNEEIVVGRSPSAVKDYVEKESGLQKLQLQLQPVFQVADFFPQSAASEKVGISVFNKDLLKLYPRIINDLLEEHNFSDEIEKFPENSSIRRDYENPLGQMEGEVVENILIAYVSDAKYRDADKVVASVAFSALRRVALSFIRCFNSSSSSRSEANICEIEEELDEIVNGLVSSKVYLDPVGYAIWEGGREGEVQLLGKVATKVETYLRNLKFKLKLWACEMQICKNLIESQ